uniref:Large ribosomal subunit protein uL22c n=1 Tax=Boldia erythrosiphon TaxID=74908 RepID=A0A1Y9TLT8_9RHOD|nr:50S ribosomal protein L22 [Boldia erythrosiphon]ARO90586.1 50S ribosomal protein L22 [Boldia erythrosiphon]
MTQFNSHIQATAKYIRTSPNKVRRVLAQLKGRSYKEAIMILEFMPYRACSYILKTLKSAAFNAQNNYNMNKKNLLVTNAYVNQGPTLKRFRPRAQGRAFRIHKPTCHITILVGIN